MDIITRLNWVDVLIIILMLRISYVAFQDGLSHEVFPLIGCILIVVFSLHYYAKIGSFISRDVVAIPQELSNFLSFLILALGSGLIIKILKGFLDTIVKVEWHPVVEKFGGLVVGVVKASIVTSIVLIIIALMPLPYLQRSLRDRSATGMYFLKIGPAIYGRVSHFLPTVKVGEAETNKEALVENLTRDKSLTPQANKKAKKIPEWEQ